LVAGVRFELTTFGLWARRSDSKSHWFGCPYFNETPENLPKKPSFGPLVDPRMVCSKLPIEHNGLANRC